MYRQGEVVEGRPAKGVAAQVTEVPRPGYAIRGQTGRCRDIERAWDGERTELDKIAGVVRVVHDGPDTIRTVVSFAAPTEIILKIVIELEGLSALQSDRAIEAPAVLQALPGAGRLRKVVGEDPGESVRHIEIRRAVLELRARAVVRLGCVWFKVLPVARIVARF